MSGRDEFIPGEVPAGRPAEGEERPALRSVVFLADPKTLEDLRLIEEDLGGERGAQSIAIRRAIQNEAARIRERSAG